LRELRERWEQNQFHLKPQAKRCEDSRPPIATVGRPDLQRGGRGADGPHAQVVESVGHPRRQNQWGETAVAALRREIEEETAWR